MKPFYFRLCSVCLLLGFLCGLNPSPALVSTFSADDDYLNIATTEARHLSIDRLVYKACKSIDYKASITPMPLETGYGAANRGEVAGVIALTPDIEDTYPNLVKVPIAIEKVDVQAFVRSDSGLTIRNWSDLSNLRVVLNVQRPYTKSQIPQSAVVTEHESTALMMNALAAGDHDVAILFKSAHQPHVNYPGLEPSGMLDTLYEYLYLNQAYAHLAPRLAQAIAQMQTDGRAAAILDDTYKPAQDEKNTILHIISSNMELSREEVFNAGLKLPFTNDMSIDWYALSLNSRRFMLESNRITSYANLLRQDCVSKNISAIVVSGEDALELVAEYYHLYFRNTPVIFYGVGDRYPEIIAGLEPYFTGLTETPSAYDTAEAALTLFPDTQRLFVLNDYTTEGRSYRRAFEEQLAPLSDRLDIEYSENIPTADLLMHIRDLPADTLVLVGSYFVDSGGLYHPQNETKRLLARDCTRPVFSLYSTDVEYNAIGGKALDYQAQGTLVAEMLAQILDGTQTVETTPVISDPEQYSRWVFDYGQMNAFGLTRKDLPAGATVINKPLSMWEADPRFVVTLLLLLLVVLGATIGITIFLTRYNKQKEIWAMDEKIRETTEQLERIINTAPVAFLMTVNGIVVKANEYIKKNLGLNEGDSTLGLYTYPHQREQLFTRIAEQEGMLESQILAFNMPGDESHRFLSNFTVTEQDGNPAYILWAMDIEEAERKRDELQVARHDLQTILDFFPLPVRIVDLENGTLSYINRAGSELFRAVSPKALCGRSAFELMPEIQSDGVPTAQKVLEIYSTDGTRSAELTCCKSDGEAFEARITDCLIEYNGHRSSVGIIHDLTAEKEHQRMLRDTARKEKEANLLKGRFLVNMSHEIRTPMNAIIGLTEIELQKNLNDKTSEIYAKINTSAKALLNIINDILDLSKIEADKIELYNDEFELEDTLNSALLVASPRLDGKNVEFMLNASLDLPRYIIGDRTRLWQILKNFLDNAAKYTDNGKIVLSVFADKAGSDKNTVLVNFVVEDTGIGIDEKQMERLFRPYEQVHNEAQKRYSGTGLGMAISKQLCEIMGGKLTMESQPGVGTVVRLSIPFKRSDKEETEAAAVECPALSGLRVLAADDDPLSLEIMQRLLENSHVECTLADSGVQALDIIRANRDKGIYFDIILLDYMMEGLNGLETARQIHQTLSRVPKLLMVTAYQKYLIKSELDRNGIDDVLEKPFIPSQFIEKFSKTMGIEQPADQPKQPTYRKYDDVHVLLCEDYLINQEVAAGMFEQFGITTTVANNGKEGIEILEQNPDSFDIIFMDLQMPVMDGYQATRHIRANPLYDHIPIISLTADAMTEVVQRCVEIGMNDHVAKPVDFQNLYRVFHRWLPESKRVHHEDDDLAAPPNRELLHRFGGNQALYGKALAGFAKSLPHSWLPYEEAMEHKDTLRRTIHKIKGGAGNLSEDELYQAAIHLERALVDGSVNKSQYDTFVAICRSMQSKQWTKGS